MKYKTVSEAIDALNKIKPCDFRSRNTTKEDAMKFSIEVMKVVYNSSNLEFSYKDCYNYSCALQNIGCCSYDEVAPQLKNQNEKIGEAISHQNLVFPISCTSNLVGNLNNFTFCLALATEGDQKSWVGEWLSSNGVNLDVYDDTDVPTDI